MRHFGTFTIALAVLFLGTAGALAQPVTLVTFYGDDGTRYGVSTGTSGGTCQPVANGYWCHNGANETSADKTTGCGNLSGQAYCVVLPPGWTPPVYQPLGTTTLECPNSTKYEVSDGSNGDCDIEGNKTSSGKVNCQDGNSNNFASASCENGCGSTGGSGKCTVK